MKKIIFISDYFKDEICGGGEKCDDALIEHLNKIANLLKIKSSNVDINFLKQNKSNNFIISNFVQLNEICKQFLQENCSYSIYEHDHKYLKNRNPAAYKDFLAPKSELINIEFYKNSLFTICQTNFHCEIVKKNLQHDNITSSSTNFWSEQEQQILLNNSNNNKEQIAFILDSDTYHKNTIGSIEYCIKNNLNYFKYKNLNYKIFVENISRADKFVFFPKTPETFGRIATECRVLNMKIHTNYLLGVSHEEWFKNLSGINLLQYIKKSNSEFLNLLAREII